MYKNIFTLLRFIIILIIINSCTSNFTLEQAKFNSEKGWNKYRELYSEIKMPEFQNNEYNISDYGAVAGGQADCRPAIIKAIEECNKNGGGKVVIPKGIFLCDGPVHLLDNVNIQISDGALLKFGTEISRYKPLVKVKWGDAICYNYSPLFYAEGKSNIAVTGAGVIDAQSQLSWNIWSDSSQSVDASVLKKMMEENLPLDERIFGDGLMDGLNTCQHYLRPDLIQFYNCENILIENFTLKNSPLANVHLVFSRNAVVKNIRITASSKGDDGIIIDSSSDVLVENCIINTKSNAILLKAGNDSEQVDDPSCKNVLLVNNIITWAWNGIVIDENIFADIRNLFVDNNKIFWAFNGIVINTNLKANSSVSDVFAREIKVDLIKNTLLDFKLGNVELNPDNRIDDVYLTDVKCNVVENVPIRISPNNSSNISRILISDIELGFSKVENEIEDMNEIIVNNITKAETHHGM
ncbi:MAG: right-handed parallel beta-helix repeat-containing protein [Melioribacteraceae bacterium]|nr:right-handed parallel beta-helix repeat-containing protein [Melioribacteraceae bacterium]